MAKSAIEWTGSTWNPVTGYIKISPGCKHCYAERMAKRLQAMGQKNYLTGFELALYPHALELPLSWEKPQTIFGARPMREEWVVCIKEKCLLANVPFFFKQWGGVRKKKAAKVLQGRTWEQMPMICVK